MGTASGPEEMLGRMLLEPSGADQNVGNLLHGRAGGSGNTGIAKQALQTVLDATPMTPTQICAEVYPGQSRLGPGVEPIAVSTTRAMPGRTSVAPAPWCRTWTY